MTIEELREIVEESGTYERTVLKVLAGIDTGRPRVRARVLDALAARGITPLGSPAHAEKGGAR